MVVFSAHGVAPRGPRGRRTRGLRAIDATCPLVTKVHNEARRFAAQDYDILLIGHEGHEEVVGTTGEAPERIHLVDGPDGQRRTSRSRDPARVVWLSQTTLSVDETNETVAALRERFPHLLDPPSDDICYATQNRQAAVKPIAAQSDLVIVVGSRNSSNSVRLVEVALDAGAPPPTWWTTPARSTSLAGRRRDGRRDQRRLGAGGTRVRGARQAGQQRVRHRRGSRGGGGAHDVRAAARAADRSGWPQSPASAELAGGAALGR